ncbi:ferredoxin [Thermoplasmatales archaeon ex4484_36]|nr:MAG: ferredoxin [Thermoplasmatales archaeon ex4484_36]RLF70548.1 MAG: ferredoxin [Thermoplasmata archaeon]RLF70619.1 MAG: ferredoxin [Thermoplasmata archaeon]HDD60768.1 ferredoxin [Euryarchaeota archaeon]
MVKKVVVNKDTCIACGVCISLCPEVFEADDEGKSQVIDGADLNAPCIQEAVDSCPTGSITVEE